MCQRHPNGHLHGSQRFKIHRQTRRLTLGLKNSAINHYRFAATQEVQSARMDC